MSMGLFIGLPLNQPVIDLVSGKTLFETMALFYEHQLSQHNMKDLTSQLTSADEPHIDSFHM